MYIIAIGWIYVTLLMALTEPNPVAAILTFAFYGLAPLALFLWLFGTPARRRRKAAHQPAPSGTDQAVDQVVGADDRGDAHQDQSHLRDGGP
jgi:hypothetical protein